jgi:hypothetical protein
VARAEERQAAAGGQRAAARERRRRDHTPSRLANENELRVLASRRRFAYLALAASVGLLLTVFGLGVARSTPDSALAEALFWLGLLVILVPFAFVLASIGPTRGERLASLLFLGVVLYLVKIVHDPYSFVYADEWVHAYNAQEIVRTGSLFHANPIIPVTARYPGLETATAALASVSGLSVFASGAILLGAVRLVLVLGLFLLFERLTGSSRIASLAGIVYLTNPNFLFWTAQFSYESLSLPLIVLSAVATVTLAFGRTNGSGTALLAHPRERFAWTFVACFTAFAAIVTHHLSAYALCIFLVAVCIVAARRPETRAQAPWFVAGFVVVATVVWAHWVAPETYSYLVPVLRRAVHETIDTITGKTSGRGLFQAAGGSHQQVASTWQRAVAIASVALVVLALPIGFREVYRRHLRHPVIVVLALAAVVYVAVLPMRLVPAAWETSNRSSEFLYVGVALTIAIAATVRRVVSGRFAVVAALCVGVLGVGGVVAGWPPRVLLSRPYRVQADGAVIVAQSRAAADWAGSHIGPGRRFIAPEALGRELLVHGGETAYVTDAPFDARSVIYGGSVTAGIVDTLGKERIPYVALSRRSSADDSMAGYFFPRRGDGDTTISKESLQKYDVFPGVSRLLDTGNVFVYDVRSLWSAAG